ncbi:DnaD domain-containing protein [Lactococcus sp. bn62]|uniref:DnaD domain-containing protein n=1 Tax=Lactococcus sp. bn62 TaxID=3037457 RepID=UPI0024C4CA9F|nr:DnaD domain protein [Lactococcus sp. bn62]WKY24621.1 DnaD domain protein [Lactococcus sp. bn62]
MKQSIKRKRAGDNFTILNNEFLRDDNLSLKAKGLLAYILSLPDDWKIYFEEIANHHKDGEGIVKKSWKELEVNGYARTSRLIDPESKRVKEWFKEASDFKNPEWQNPQGGKATSGKPTRWESQNVENDPLLKTNTPNTNKPITDKQIKSSSKSELISFWEENFGLGSLNGYTLQRFDDWLEDHSEEMVIKAAAIAVENNERTIRYVNGILKNWENKGIKNLADLENHESKRKNSKFKTQVSKQLPKNTKKIPEWSDEAKLIKAGIDTTGMSQNEMYHLVREKGLANG